MPPVSPTIPKGATIMQRPVTLAALLIAVSLSCAAQHPWQVTQLSFQARNSPANPYTAIPVDGAPDLLSIDFKGLDGDAKGQTIRLAGCWNGGREWIVNFAAPAAGTWSYRTASSDRGMDKKTGTLKVIPWSDDDLAQNPTRRGLIQVMKTGDGAGHYFQYADGSPFLWIGDTWWNWTKPDIHLETWQQLVDDRAAKGFTVGQLFVPGNGWSPDNSALDTTYTVLNPEQVKRVEKMIAYANEKGITVWIHGWWSRENLDVTVGAEKMMRWWRYLVHRFAAYNVIWVLAGEYNMHNNAGFPLSFWHDLGNLIEQNDPYDRITGIHNTPPFWSGGAEAPQWTTGTVFHEAKWLDYHQSQVGHGRYANEMIPLIVAEDYNRTPPKPTVVTEPWYEFVEGNPTDKDIRLAAWGAILSGAAGHTYGGGHIWPAHVPESPGGAGVWPLEKEFTRTTYDYKGAVSMSILAKFFKPLNWWQLRPMPELVHDYPQPFCLADPGNQYLIYLRYGGYLTIDLPPGNYTYYWFDPATGKKQAEKTMTAAGKSSFVSPGMYPGTLDFSDWVLHISRKPD